MFNGLSIAASHGSTFRKPQFSEVFMNIQINDQWQSIYTLTGLAIGTVVDIQNQSPVNVYFQASASAPQAGFVVGGALSPLEWGSTAKHSINVWCRTSYGNGSLFVEEA